ALDRQREDERPDVGESQSAEDDPGKRGGSGADQEKPEARETQERAPAEEVPGVEKVENEGSEQTPRGERDEEEAGPQTRGRGGEVHAEGPRQVSRQPGVESDLGAHVQEDAEDRERDGRLLEEREAGGDARRARRIVRSRFPGRQQEKRQQQRDERD